MDNNLTTRIPPRAAALLLPPRRARRLSWSLFVLMAILPFVMAFLPWNQNINANGRVIAYDPEERMQNIEAPQDGRIYRIYTKENDRVTKGQLLVSIQDPDPQLQVNELNVRKNIENRKQAAESRVQALRKQLVSQELAMKDALVAADKQIEVARQTLRSAEQAVEAAKEDRILAEITYRMEKRLVNDGLTPEIQYQNARTTLSVRKATELSRIATRDSAIASVDAAIARRSEI
ncbi:MAG: biotin/lipoyl-binding protein [Gemmataceae bacterium]